MTVRFTWRKNPLQTGVGLWWYRDNVLWWIIVDLLILNIVIDSKGRQ